MRAVLPMEAGDWSPLHVTEAKDRLLARQPILDRRHRIVGYELLFRPRPSAARGVAQGSGAGKPSDPDRATASVLVDTFATIGADALLGEAIGFVNVTEALLGSDLVAALPHRRVVLELPRLASVSRELEKRCRELAKRGFRLSLQDFERRDPREPLLAHASYAKFALDSVKPGHLKQLVRKLQRANAKVVAARVETTAELELAKQAGFDLFQGFYFARPVTVPGKRIDPDRAVVMDLLTKLSQDCDLDEVGEVFKKHPALGVNLLRLANSGHLARANRVKTVPEALVLIGRNHLSRWLTLLLYAGDDQNGMEGALLETAARRGRVVELLHGELAGSEGLERTTGDLAFLTGMLSLMDVLFGVPMREVLDQVSVDGAVRDALLHGKGVLATLLRIEEHMEAGAFDEVDPLLEEVGLDAEALVRAQNAAHAWVCGSGSQRFGV